MNWYDNSLRLRYYSSHRLSPTHDVTAYRTLWFGLQYDSETVEQGEAAGNDTLATYAGTTASSSAMVTCRGSSRPSKISAAA